MASTKATSSPVQTINEMMIDDMSAVSLISTKDTKLEAEIRSITSNVTFPVTSHTMLITEIKSVVPKCRINYRMSESNHLDRFIVTLNSTNRIHTINNASTHYHCNGIVYDADNGDILAMPPPVLCKAVNRKFLEKHLSEFTIYSASDSSILTLYHDGSSWCISTKHGIDISASKWTSSKSWKELLDEALTKYNIKIDQLNTDVSYTFALHHPDVHPYLDKPSDVYVIKMWHQELHSMYNCEYVANVPVQTEVVFPPVVECQDAINSSVRSMTNQEKVDFMLTASRASLTTSRSTNMGYILRCKTNKYIDVYIESFLKQRISNLIYNISNMEYFERIAPEARMDFIILKAYFKTRYKDHDVLKMFPNWSTKFNAIGKLINEIVDKVLLIYRKSAVNTDDTSDRLAKFFYDEISKKNPVDPFVSDAISIIKDHVLDNRKLQIVWSVMVETNWYAQ
jgi:hypothetical protein